MKEKSINRSFLYDIENAIVPIERPLQNEEQINNADEDDDNYINDTDREWISILWDDDQQTLNIDMQTQSITTININDMHSIDDDTMTALCCDEELSSSTSDDDDDDDDVNDTDNNVDTGKNINTAIFNE